MTEEAQEDPIEDESTQTVVEPAIEEIENEETAGSPSRRNLGLKTAQENVEQMKDRGWIAQPGADFVYNEVACCCLPANFPLRRAFVAAMEWKWFDRIVMSLIGANCITLALFDPADRDCLTDKCKVLGKFDLVFTVCFALEMFIKIIAMGFIGRNGRKAYLGDSWNRLDFVIVVSSLLDLMPFLDSGALSLLRTLRVLRPLRAINKLPGLRVLVQLLMDCIPALRDVCILQSLIFLVFSIVGLQLFPGMFQQRCTLPLQSSDFYAPDDMYVCSKPETGGLLSCPPVDGNDVLIPEWLNHTECKAVGKNPFATIESFDNIASSLLVVFQVISCEMWIDLMYPVMDGYSPWVMFYFIGLIFIGNFFAVNLFLVIITTQFTETKQRQQDEADAALKKEKDEASAAEASTAPAESSLHKDEDKLDVKPGALTVGGNVGDKIEDPPPPVDQAPAKLADDVVAGGEGEAPSEREGEREGNPARGLGDETDRPLEDGEQTWEQTPPPPVYEDAAVAKDGAMDNADGQEPTECQLGSEVVQEAGGGFARFRAQLDGVARSGLFGNCIMSCIVLNTITMASQYHDQPGWLDDAQTIANYIFAGIFTVEMFVKLLAFGPAGYFSDASNVFDAVIVFTSLLEIVIGGGGAMSVLRAFRAMRVLKLVSFLPGLRKQIEIVASSVGGMGNFLIILLLFMFIYAILGMHLFGDKFTFDGEHVRKNFDSLFWAFISVFQVLTVEDWPETMSYGVEATSPVAALYFVSLIILGQYVLISLFVAIVLEGFAIRAKEDEMKLIESIEEQKKNKGEAFTKIKNVMSGRSDAFLQEMWSHWKMVMVTSRGQPQQPHEPDSQGEATLAEATEESIPEAQKEEAPPVVSPHGKDADLPSSMSFPGSPPPLPPLDHSGLPDSPVSPSGRPFLLPALPDLHSRPDPGLRAPCGHAICTAAGGNSCRLADKKMMEKIAKPVSMLPEPAESTAAVKEATALSGASTGSNMWHSSDTPALVAPSLRPPSPDTPPPRPPSPDLSDVLRSPSREGRGGLLPPISNPSSPVSTGTEGSPTPHPTELRSPSPNPPLQSPGTAAPVDAANAALGVGEPSAESSSALPQGCGAGGVIQEGVSYVIRSEEAEAGQAVGEQVVPGQAAGETTAQEDADDVEQGKAPPGEQVDADNIEGIGVEPSEGWPEEGEAAQDGEKADEEEDGGPEREDHSLMLFARSGAVRSFAIAVVNNAWFDRIVLVLICCSGILMAIDRPSIEDGSFERRFLDAWDLVFLGAFTVEFILKVLAMGFAWGKMAYLKSSWNRLDGLLVLISWVNFTLDVINVQSSAAQTLRILRILRTLRPLRVIQRAPGLRLLVRCFAAAIVPAAETSLICGVVYIIFGILGLQLFCGKMHYCSPANNNGDEGTAGAVDDKAGCLALGSNYRWQHQHLNFDNIGNAIVTLFYLSTGDGWVGIMYTGIDARDVDKNPQRDANKWMALYFVAFVIIGNFFLLNMFVGVIVDNFQRMSVLLERLGPREKGDPDDSESDDEGDEEFDLDQKGKEDESGTWGSSPQHRLSRRVSSSSHSEVISPLRAAALRQIVAQWFEIFIAACIILNIVAMACEFYDMPEAYKTTLTVINLFFSAVFVYEFVVKLYALHWKEYIVSAWNKFDFFLVIMSFVGLLFDYVLKDVGMDPTLLRALRIFRVARILRLLRGAEGLQKLIATVMKSLPQVLNMGALLFLVYFIFACAGVEMFGKLGCTDTMPCNGLDNRHAHFRNFPYALLTLFRITTGDNGNGIYQDTMRSPPLCDDAADCQMNCCAMRALAPLYFIMFTIASQFVLLNVVVAVLMQQLADEAEENAGEEAAAASFQLQQATAAVHPEVTDCQKSPREETDGNGAGPDSCSNEELGGIKTETPVVTAPEAGASAEIYPEALRELASDVGNGIGQSTADSKPGDNSKSDESHALPCSSGSS